MMLNGDYDSWKLASPDWDEVDDDTASLSQLRDAELRSLRRCLAATLNEIRRVEAMNDEAYATELRRREGLPF